MGGGKGARQPEQRADPPRGREILRNSVPVNETFPRNTEPKEISGGTVLLGCADIDGIAVPVMSIFYYFRSSIKSAS